MTTCNLPCSRIAMKKRGRVHSLRKTLYHWPTKKQKKITLICFIFTINDVHFTFSGSSSHTHEHHQKKKRREEEKKRRRSEKKSRGRKGRRMKKREKRRRRRRLFCCCCFFGGEWMEEVWCVMSGSSSHVIGRQDSRSALLYNEFHLPPPHNLIYIYTSQITHHS